MEGIKLNVDDLVIDGNGHTIDAKGKTRIFYCTGKNIAIKNITLKNGFTEQDGGAIYNYKGELTITESALNSNTAKGDGGAIHNYCGELTITISTFDENIANENGMDIFNDGRIFSKENLSNVIQINSDIGKFYHLKSLKNNQKDFTYLNELINTETNRIKLENDIVLNIANNEQKTFENGIGIYRDNLVIDGNGHTIDAQSLTRIFYCTGKNVIIKNIVLKNGFSKEYGGAIDNSGELTIIESTLTGNTAERDGGTINNIKGELTIIESTLNENTAQGEYGRGGAINNIEGELTITKSSLTRNTAEKDGGAIHDYGGEITITESTLTENTAKRGGGAISNNGELTVMGSTLTENTADLGGAISNYGELTITESTLQHNTANYGGAIYNRYGELTITESTLTENTADLGGAISNSEGNFKIYNCKFSNNKSPNNIILNKDSLQIHNTIFRDNQSKFIVLNDGDVANLGIFYGEFSDNNVEESVLSNTGKFCIVEKTVFQNNISNNAMNIINKSELTLTNPNIKDEGKSILNQNYILIKKSSPELENKIYGEGTVKNIDEIILQGENFDFGYLNKKIHESNSHEIILDHDITFENYERDFYEGGIELDIDNLTINGNGHTIDGVDKSRIFIITGKNITLKNIIFKNGHSHKNYDNPLNNNGGAIKINHNLNITIENCEFINNTSEKGGGAISNNSGGKLTITESTLTGNTANYGGAIYNYGGKLTLIKSTLTENTVEKSGGAIYNIKGELTIIKSSLIRNISRELCGGAIDNIKGEFTITESALTGNTAEFEGGAINNDEGELTVMGSTLTENTAKMGGAINNDKGELTIIESTLTENTAQDDGGAILSYRGMLSITESTLLGNTAKMGGAILLKDSKYESNNCTFKDNEPDDVYEQ